MKKEEPKIVQDLEPGRRYYHWPDGTLREISRKEWFDSNVSTFTLIRLRLRFIFHVLVTFIRNFKSIEVSENVDGGSKRKYEVSYRKLSKFEGKNISRYTRRISLGSAVGLGEDKIESLDK